MSHYSRTITLSPYRRPQFETGFETRCLQHSVLQTHCRPGNLPPCPVPVDAPSDRCGDAIMTAVGGGVFLFFKFW